MSLFDNKTPRRVAVLGSSGSIGRSALEVIAESDGRLEIAMLSVHRRTDTLVEQVQQLAMQNVAAKIKSVPSVSLPDCVIVTDEKADRTPLQNLPSGIEVRFGYDALCEYVRQPDIDIVLSAIVGAIGLTSTWSALETGKTVALANKESLVMGGSLLTELAQKTGGRLLPVDSEHSAVMQSLRSWRMVEDGHATSETVNDSVERLILTASGGPFRTWSLEELSKVTVQEALSHPTWQMGKKITIDSATLMNKALEIIEARWFFDMPVAKLDVVIHPQSIVHSMVEFIDGSIVAQLSPPDMRLPIQLALNYPNRFDGPATRLDWKNRYQLDFYAPDLERFSAIALGLEVAGTGGTSGTVVNAANEVAVAAFLEERIPFERIVPTCRSILEYHHYEHKPTIDRLLELDRWAREEAEKIFFDH